MDEPLLLCAGIDALQGRLGAALSACGYRIVCVPAPISRIPDGSLRSADVVIIGSPGTGQSHDAASHVENVRSFNRFIPIIVISGRSSEAEALSVLSAGANEYLEDTVSAEHLDVAIRVCLRRASRMEAGGSGNAGGSPRLLGASAAMTEIRAAVLSIASVDSNVLVTGETGTGKELVAESIHEQSARRDRPFVRVNCAAIPDTLFESELFGHERGAFTGADSARDGFVPLAEGGTIFFDEIGELSFAAQAKLLRAIESKEVYRLGGKRCIPVNVRVIAVTNQDIDRMVDDGRFRSDLYFRLNVARVHLPPLRDRSEDVPLLCTHYISEFNRRFERQVAGVSDDVLARLLKYEWPGNVRELRNVIEGTYLKVRNGCISLNHLSEHFLRRLNGTTLPANERERLIETLFSTNWNKSRAAEQLRWSRMTLYRRMAKYNIVGARRAARSDH